MRRIGRYLVLAVALLAVWAPASQAATKVTLSATSVGATQALIHVHWEIDFLGSVAIDYQGGSTAVESNVTANGDRDVLVTGLVPGTAYTMRGHVREPGTVNGPPETLGPAIAVTTPAIGGPVLAQLDSLRTATPKALAVPTASSMQSCAKPGVAPAVTGPNQDTRFQIYQLLNPAATAACVTVQVTSDCVDLRVGAFTTDPVGSDPNPSANVKAANQLPASPGPTKAEFQVMVGASAPFWVAVSDDDLCDVDYTIGVFATTVVPPLATTSPAAFVGAKSATIAGTTSARFLKGISARFEYGTTTSYGKTVAIGALPVNGTVLKPATRLTGLLPNTVYHVRLVAVSAGTIVARGVDVTFKTLKKQKPLALRTTSAGVNGAGQARFRIACPATTLTCAGKLALNRTTGRKSSLGSKSFRIKGGQTATITLKLSASVRRLVKSRGTLAFRGTLTGKDGDRVAFPKAGRNGKLVWRG